MTFRMAFTQHLPTLALVSLGASELQVGLQNAFPYAFIALQLVTLRAMARVPKRRILVASHVFAVASALPLVFFQRIRELGPDASLDVALVSFALVAAGHAVGETVWFPLLRGYVEPERVGRFFGALRTGWHLSLIGYFLLCQSWLSAHPGSFGPLFALGLLLGAARTLLIARLPERSERTGQRIRVSEALRLLRDPALRRYLLTVSWGHALRVAVLPFVVVMMRRVLGFDDGQVIYTTVAFFAGGLVSLYPWGRIVDRVGPLPVFVVTTTGQGLLVLALHAAAPGQAVLPLMVLWFFALSVLAAGFGVADTHRLFELAPPEAPARTLVLGAVSVGLAGGLASVGSGFVLELALPERAAAGLDTYRVFFAVTGVALGLASLPVVWGHRRS